MRRRRSRNQDSDPGVDLTPMVDVVFLLLVFFVFAVKPLDLLATVTARAAGGGEVSVSMVEIRIQVLDESYLVNGKPMGIEALDAVLEKTTRFAPDAQVAIACIDSAPHARLVGALDLCEKNGLTNVRMLRQERFR